MSNLKKIIILLLLCIVGWGVYYITVNNVKIVEVELTSPDNSALKEDIRIVLNKPSSVYIEYWKEGAEPAKPYFRLMKRVPKGSAPSVMND